jgi:hypothetical protein
VREVLNAAVAVQCERKRTAVFEPYLGIGPMILFIEHGVFYILKVKPLMIGHS